MPRARGHHMASNVQGESLTKSPKKAGGTETGIARVMQLDFQGLGGERWGQQACLEVEGQPWEPRAGR